MSNLQVLTLGTNANLAFYAWRLQNTGACSVSIVNAHMDAGSLNWSSSSFGKSNLYHPYRCSQDLSQIIKGTIKFDIAIIGCTSLQDFQTTCSNLSPYLAEEAVVLIESTGYINLEPFVALALSRQNVRVGSIMNESDVKHISPHHFVHKVRGDDNRIYLGTATDKLLASTAGFKRCYKLFQLAQEDSNGALALLKSTNPTEFMTYQWKLALPRIVFSPLSIIFEAEFPQTLANQILCKPLISGIINECFKIIKKMDCKLVKGFENEANLLKNWSSCYPNVAENANYVQSPSLFYRFFHRLDLEIDLLLLQPILLGDDHGVKTPYLENLYSTMCQLNRYNSSESESIFFVRKNAAGNKARMAQLDSDYDTKMNEFNALNEEMHLLELKKASMMSYITEKEHMKKMLDADLAEQTNRLESLKVDTREQSMAYETKRRELDDYQADHRRRVSEMEDKEAELRKKHEKLAAQATGPNAQDPPKTQLRLPQKMRSSPKAKNPRDSTMTTNENLQDLTDIALYGAALNGEQPPRSLDNFMSAEDLSNYPHPNVANGSNGSHYGHSKAHRRQESVPGSFPGDEPQQFTGYQNDGRYQDQKHAERKYQDQQNYQQLEQPPMDRSQSLGLDTRMRYYENGNGPAMKAQNGMNAPNGYYQSPMDQHPPHGLPHNGMPANSLPPNLRVNVQVPRQYTGPPPGTHPGYAKQRQSSIPSSYSYYDQQRAYGNQYQQYQQYPQYQGPPHNVPYNQPPPGFQGYNEPSFQYAAPIDPGVESRFKSQQRRSNRRSALPQMGNPGFEMGGRGGMPGANPQSLKHRSMQPLAPQHLGRASQGGYGAAVHAGQTQNPPPNGHQASSSQPPRAASAQQFLQLPNSNVSSTSSMNTGDTPKTSDEGASGIKLNVPIADNAKPLGGLSHANKETWELPKKKGFFGKKK